MATPYAQSNTALANGSRSNDLAALIARALLVAVFLISGLQHDWRFTNTAAYLALNGFPAPYVVAVSAIAIEIFAGLMVLTGWNARWAALALAIYTILQGLLFHAYWNYSPPARLDAFVIFWKNISIAGGFLMVFALGPGRYSVQRN